MTKRTEAPGIGAFDGLETLIDAEIANQFWQMVIGGDKNVERWARLVLRRFVLRDWPQIKQGEVFPV